MKYRSVVLLVNLLVLITILKGDKKRNATSTRYTEAERELVRKRRKFGSAGPPCGMIHGVYLERWDRIDYKRVRFLLSDPRYPNLPSLALCVPTFEQPQNWADFFGARIRTYFVPNQSGDHLFFLSSNAGSELYISTDETAAHKTEICLVSGGFPSEPYEYDRYATQRSLPVHLIKGKFYYMESIMKDDHQTDHLEVGLETPDGTFYKVIPSAFLWTIYERSYAMNATHRAIFLKVAAEAGAKAGLSLGAKFAMRSGARAGAKAGAKAGMLSGASAGAVAGVKAAIKMTTTALEDSLNALHGDSANKYKINVEGGEVVSVTGPGIEGGNGAAVSATSSAAAVAGSTGAAGGVGGGTRSAAVAAAAAGAASVGGVLGSLGNRSAGLGGAAAGGGVTGGGRGGAAAAAAAGGVGGAAGGTAGGAVEGATGGAAEAGIGEHSGVTGSSSSSTGGEGEGTVKPGYNMPEGRGVVNVGGKLITELTYTPKPGEDSQIKAKDLVWKAGGARLIVANAMYTIHSYNIPDQQEDFSLNQCWKSHRGDIVVDIWCNVFIARVPSISPKAGIPVHTVSFESACFPGYFVRQKNFRFILQKRDGSDVFDRESSFHIFAVMRYSRNFLFHSTHQDWYICQSAKKKYFGTSVILDYYNGQPDVLERCTFVLSPNFKDPLQNCKNALGPVKAPQINGEPLPHPSGLIQHKPTPPFVLPSCIPMCRSGERETVRAIGTNAQGASGAGESAVEIPSSSRASSKKMCVALNVINKFGPRFKLFSSLKNEGYLVTGPGFRLKLIVDSPTLHKNLIFYAKDPDGRRTILLNGTPTLSEPVTLGCPDFANVIVSGEQGPPFPPNSPTLYPAIPPVHVPRTTPLPGQAHGPGTASSKSGSAHFHYHYHGSKMTGRNQACPSNCSSVGECGPPCPELCCKRDLDESDNDPD